MQNKTKQRIGKISAVLLALIFWQLAAMTIHQNIVLVTPIAVAKRMATIWQVEGFATSIWFTFYHIVAGFFLGLLLGLILATLAAKWSWIETLLWPFMVTVKTVPVASFVIIGLIWLSSKNLSILISFLVVLPVVYQNMLTGIRSVDPKLMEMATVFRMPWYKRLQYIVLPNVKPYLVTACSITTGMAWKAGVAAEIIGVPKHSIGQMLYYAKIYIDTDDLLAWTVIIVILSVAFEKLFMLALRKLLKVSKTEEV